MKKIFTVIVTDNFGKFFGGADNATFAKSSITC